MDSILGVPALAAAIVTSTLALIGVLINIAVTLHAGRRTGARAVAAFRQQWIDNLRKTLAEYHSIKMSAELPLSLEDDRAVSNLGTQIELMLNPHEDASQQLEVIIDKIDECQTLDGRVALDPQFIAAARRVLKLEWDRVKKELR